MAQSIHIYPDPDGGWVVKRAGEQKDLGHFNQRGGAESFARQACAQEHAELFVHQLDGSVEQRLI